MNKLFEALLKQASGKISPALQQATKTVQSSFTPAIDTTRGIIRNLQNAGPTALNPLATRQPTTNLGRVGKFFNPLNPTNIIESINPAPGMTMGARLASGLGLTGLGGSAVTVGGGLASIGAVDLLFPRSIADGTLDAAGLNTKKNQNIKPKGPSIGTKNTQGQYWAGEDWGYQSPGSFNKLYGTRLQSGLMDRSDVNPPGSTPPSAFSTGQQAGQTTPPVAPPPPGAAVMSNGAGVPAQRQNVQDRALSQEVLNAAQQYSAPAGVSLSSFYEGQQQLGRSMMQKGTLVSELQSLGAGAGMTPENLRTWATQNPDLAYRELLKLRRNQ